MSVQPETKHDEIINAINRLAYEGPDEFTIRRIEHDAEALLKVDAVHGYMALGALASLKNDANGVKNWHEKSLRLRQNDPNVSYNYALSLRRVGFNAEAAHYAEIALNQGCHDRVAVSLFLETTVGMGKFMSALSLVRDPITLPEEFNALLGITEFMKASGFTDEDFLPIARQAEEVALAFETPFHAPSLRPLRDDMISILLPVKVDDPVKLADMNEELADRIAAIDARPGVVSSLVIFFTAVD